MQTVNHALLLLSTLQTHQAQNGEQDQAISELRNELSSKDQRINEAAATAAAASTATATLTKRLESLESGPSDVKKLQNDVKKLQSKNKELESKNEELGKELKHLRESLKQEAAWRHEATKQMTSSTSSG
jgi:chromosome segregation ATPase